MFYKKKTFLFISGSILLTILILFLIRIYFNYQISKEIPDISDSRSLSEAVNAQIRKAAKKAKINPSSEKLGQLGMVYHSNANYIKP